MCKFKDETPEDINYYKCLQLDIFSDAIKDRQPYSDVAECFTDVEITEQEYNEVLANPAAVADFMRAKGYTDEAN
jgi:hypothetical protein